MPSGVAVTPKRMLRESKALDLASLTAMDQCFPWLVDFLMRSPHFVKFRDAWAAITEFCGNADETVRRPIRISYVTPAGGLPAAV